MRYFKQAPGQALDWQQALGSAAWQDADPEGMAALRQATTMWMQLEVKNTSSSVQTRWVVVDYWALMDAQLFIVDAQSPILLAHKSSGQKLAPEQRDQATEQPAFAVTLQPGQRARLLLRVSDLYWSHMVVNAWDGPSYAATSTSRKLVYAVALGAVLALGVALLLQRSRNLALVAAWMVLSFLLEITYTGLMSEWLFPARLISPVMILLLLGTLINSASAFITMYFMGLDQHRFWYRWNWALLVIGLVLSLAVLGTRSNPMRQAMSLLNLLMVMSNLTLLMWARIRGYPLRQLMASVMALNFSLAVARIVMRQFYVEPDIFQTMTRSVMLVKGCLILLVIALVALQRQRDQAQVRMRLQALERQQREDLQAAVEQRTDELHQALVMAREASNAKTDFLARISHDLRSPLTSIMGYAQLLQRAVNGQARQYSHSIARSADHMRTLVNDLIEYASGTSDRLKVQPVYINALLEAVAQEATVQADRQRNRFVMRIDKTLPPVLVTDGRRLRQILTNLLENAIKFTSEGQVELLVGAAPQPSPAQLPAPLDLVLTVRDSGMGISAEDQAKLFEPFFRSRDAAQVPGVGLGLSIVKVWVERLGGDISLQSTPGQGSTFTLRLPVTVGLESQMPATEWLEYAEHLPTLESAGHCIWVVEDNPDIRAMLTEELRSTGFAVKVSDSGREFLEQMRDPGNKPPSLVLTDYLMPDGNGDEVLRAVRGHWPGVPVVLLSATRIQTGTLGTDDDEAGFDACLMKPVNLADLRTTLARLLALVCSDEAQTSTNQDPSETPGELRKPPETELARASLMARMGAISDLKDWAAGLQQSGHGPFAERMTALLDEARFDDILALCQEET